MRVESQSLLEKLPTTSLNVSWESPAISIEHIYGYSVQAAWTGSPNGTLKLQGSSQPLAVDQVSLITQWDDIPTASIDVSTASRIMFNVRQEFYKFFRVVFVSGATGGSITYLAYHLKGV